MANKLEPLITVAEALEVLAEHKETVKPISWVPKPVGGNVQWMDFTSVCLVKGELRDDVIFRMTYRHARTEVHGQATILLPESFCASLFVGPHRVYGVDTDDAVHTNHVGTGMPHYRKRLADRSHEHLWVAEGEGYAQPVEPALLTIASLMDYFLPKANLTLTGGFAHPLKGRQIEFIL